MSDHVMFWMQESYRQWLIDNHLFYVEQARERLISQFNDLSGEAEKAQNKYLEKCRPYLGCEDPGEIYEQAHEEGIEFYLLLSNMRERTVLSVVAGIFHEWDKQLREWLVREIQHWHHGDNVRQKVWSVDFKDIFDLLESFGWDVRGTACFPVLDACRLVVNVYKHGDGKSLEDLKSCFPEYLNDPFAGIGVSFSDVEYRNHTHLKVTSDQFQQFSDAIVAFWRDVPDKIVSSQVVDVPAWLSKAIQKDHGTA